MTIVTFAKDVIVEKRARATLLHLNIQPHEGGVCSSVDGANPRLPLLGHPSYKAFDWTMHEPRNKVTEERELPLLE